MMWNGARFQSLRSKLIAMMGGVLVCFVALQLSNREQGRDVVIDRGMTKDDVSFSKTLRDYKPKHRAKRKIRQSFLPPLPNFGGDIVVTGHIDPDSDSVGSSIGVAHLFNGTAMYCDHLNRETLFLLQHFNCPMPKRLEDSYRGQHFVIVDHNAFSQRPKILNATKIIGIFDHHALAQEPTVVPQPIYADIKPWGSCCTVVATKYLEHQKEIPPEIAGMLLGGLLSDTLNLKSPTTVDWDRKIRDWLAAMTYWTDKNGKQRLGRDFSRKEMDALLDQFTHKMFQAKANTTGMTLLQIALADFKYYGMTTHTKRKINVGWGTIECVDPFFRQYLSQTTLTELIKNVMPKIKREKSVEYIYISLVDLETEESAVICSDEDDCDLLYEAFPGEPRDTVVKTNGFYIETTPWVSRKEQFIPPLRKAIYNRT